MRTMKGEVLLNIPAMRAWKMYRDNNVISCINPNMLSSAAYLQGDGSPGSIRLFNFGPELNGYVKESMEKIQEVEEGRFVIYDVVGGELRKMYDPYHVTISFFPIPGKEQEKCMAEWKVEFKLVSMDVPPPERAKAAALCFLESFENCRL